MIILSTGRSKKSFKLPMRIKLFISYYLIFSIPVIFLGTLGYLYMRSISMQKVEQSYYSRLEDVTGTVDQEFNQFNKIAVQLSRENWVKDLYTEQANEDSSTDPDPIQLNKYKENFVVLKSINKLISNISLSVKKSDIIISSEGINHYASFFDDSFRVSSMKLDDWDQITSQYNFNYVISPAYVYVNSINKKGMIYIRSVPFTSRQVIGTMIIFVEDERFKEVINGIVDDDTVAVCIYNENGKLLSAINSDYDQMSALADREGLFTSNKGSVAIKLDGQKKIMFYSISEKSGWKYAVIVPPSVLASKVGDLKTKTGSIIIVLLLAGITVTYKLSSKNYLPVRKLINMVNSKRDINQNNSSINEYDILQQVIGEVFQENDLLEEQLERYRPLLANSYLVKLINGEINVDGELIRILEFLHISFPYRYFMTCCFQVRQDSTIDMMDLKRNFMEQEMEVNWYFADIGARQTAILFNFSDSDSIRTVVGRLKQLIEEQYDVVLYLGAGNLYMELEKIKISYREAQEALNYKFIAKETILYYGDISRTKEVLSYPPDSLVRLYNCLKAGNLQESLKMFEELLVRNVEEEKVSIGALNGLIYELTSVQAKVAEELRLTGIDINTGDISRFDNIEQLKQAMIDAFSSICHAITEEKETRKNSARRDILDWLENNYTNSDISLLYVAEKFNVSVSYIGKMVKEQTGSSFVDFINRKRIEMSKELLQKSNLSINNIARTLGYSNDTTFRRLFVRYVGIAPGEFRSLK